MVGLILMIALVAFLYRGTPVRYVRLEGQFRHLDPADLEQALKPLLADGYLGWNLAPLVKAAKQFPWVDDVRMERVFPDVLVVQVEEQVAYARWGERDLLNAKGERFTPAPDQLAEFAALPLLCGPEGHEGQLFSAYRKMSEALLPLQLKIRTLEVNARRSWQLTLDSGMVIVLGRIQPEEVFFRVVEFLARLTPAQRQRIERLDARYEHGFAVRWRKSAVVSGK
ncbi:hypothetical protein JCM13664_03950 [Methylothermus subterraneus]